MLCITTTELPYFLDARRPNRTCLCLMFTGTDCEARGLCKITWTSGKPIKSETQVTCWNASFRSLSCTSAGVSFGGQGGLSSRCSLIDVRQMCAAEDEGGEWCPMHGYTEFSLAGDIARLSCRARHLLMEERRVQSAAPNWTLAQGAVELTYILKKG